MAGERQTEAPRGRTLRPSTAAEVAALAGVSQSAVSRTFTPGASVSAKTRAKVVEAADALAYRPNFIARSLSTRRSNIVGLAIGNLENPFYARLLAELAATLGRSGRHLLLFPNAPGSDADPGIEEILSYQPDALVLASTTMSSKLAIACARVGLPVLQINRRTDVPTISTITGQNRRGGAVIAKFLVAGGHQHFAHIAGLATTSTARERQVGYLAELRKAGIEDVPVANGDYTGPGAASAARRLLSSRRRPDAVFVANDFMARVVLDLARREFALDIPRQLSIVGFDGIAKSAAGHGELTTFSQPVSRFALETTEAVDLLLRDATHKAIHKVIGGQLLVGETARLPKNGVRMSGGQRVWSPPR